MLAGDYALGGRFIACQSCEWCVERKLGLVHASLAKLIRVDLENVLGCPSYNRHIMTKQATDIERRRARYKEVKRACAAKP